MNHQKVSIENFFQHPYLILFVLLLSVGLTVFFSQSFATTTSVKTQVGEIVTYVDRRHDDIKEDLKEIKEAIRQINLQTLEMYKIMERRDNR